jgi:ADP-heptose:LPS heptosyltransferase
MYKILFVRSDRLGEFLLSLYAIKLTKLNYPQSKIYLLAQKFNIELIRDIDFIDYFLEYKNDRFCGYRGAFRLAKLLKKEKFDCIVILNPKKEFHLACFLANIPLRVGYGRKWGFCLNRKIEDKKFLEEKHEVEYNIDLVSLICKKVTIPEVNLPVDGKEILFFIKDELDLDEKFFVIHPFSSNSKKKMDNGFWLELIKKIKDNFKREVVLIGAQQEKEESLEFERKAKIKNLTGRLTLKNLATFLKHNCFCLLGLDSAPLHLASILKVPVVGFFKITSPKRWGPYKTHSLIIENDFFSKLGEIISFLENISDFSANK